MLVRRNSKTRSGTKGRDAYHFSLSGQEDEVSVNVSFQYYHQGARGSLDCHGLKG
jgi:hypothetical protein